MPLTTYGSDKTIKTANHDRRSTNESANLITQTRNLASTVESDPEVDEISCDLDDSEYFYTWTQYVASWRFFELVVCIVPFAAAVTFYNFDKMILPRMRPIPFQHIYNYNDGEATASDTLVEEVNRGEYESYTNTVFSLVNNEKHIGDTIPHTLYALSMGLCPLLLQLAIAWYLDPLAQQTGNNFHRWDILHRTTCMYFVGIGTTEIVINLIKYYVGYLRPIFLEVCQPHYSNNEGTFRCRDEEDYDTLYARTSFPSNHAGGSFCTMLLLSMYLERRFGLSRIRDNRNFRVNGGDSWMNKSRYTVLRRKEQWRRINYEAVYRLVSLLCYSPMLLATFIAASRIVDNKHFPADVVCGGILGGYIASLIFSIWFPHGRYRTGAQEEW